MNSISDHRRFYAEFVVKLAGVSDADIIDAFAIVPREEFLGPGPWSISTGSGYLQTISNDPRLIYQDVLVGLDTERNINNGQPSLHAACLAALAPLRGESVVHIGAGTGYYSAILSKLVGPSGSVLAFELEKDLAERAAICLQSYPNVQLRATSATDAALPVCDAIYVNAGATHPPANWLFALRVGGRLLLPLTPNEGLGFMLLITRKARDVYGAKAIGRVAFIPCVGARDDSTSDSLWRALERRPLAEIRSLRIGTPADETAWCVGNGWWLSTVETH